MPLCSVKQARINEFLCDVRFGYVLRCTGGLTKFPFESRFHTYAHMALYKISSGLRLRHMASTVRAVAKLSSLRFPPLYSPIFWR
jgi:hypothetical protein